MVGCSGVSWNFDGDLNDYLEISQSLKRKVEEMKLVEAITEFDQVSTNGKKWCLRRYSSNTNCARKDESIPRDLIEEISNAKKCLGVLGSCQKFSGLRKVDLRSCISNLKNNCKVRDKWDTAYPNAYNKLVGQISKQITNAKLGSIKMSESEKNRLEQCQKNWVWSYNKRKDKYNKSSTYYNVFGIPSHDPIGKFNSLKDCNSARKETPDEYRHGLHDKDHCFKRYVGNDESYCRQYL